jgi:hypothetical protein
MRITILSALILAGASLLIPSQANAAPNDVSFTLGTGFPYVGSLEASMPAFEGNQRWFANYKIGLDDGFSLGFEHALDDDKHHAIGVMYGALGIRNDDTDCPESEENTVESFFGVIIGCSLAAAFDWETINGVGLSYSYNVSGLNNAGWRFRVEGGSGKGAVSDKTHSSASFIASYQF